MNTAIEKIAYINYRTTHSNFTEVNKFGLECCPVFTKSHNINSKL